MSNYKVRVNNEAESREVQELFFELGYKWGFRGAQYYDVGYAGYPNIIRTHTTGAMTHSLRSEVLYKENKEITIQQLRDLVVLKRNDVGDASHIYDVYKVLKLDSMDYKIWNMDSNTWVDHIGSQTDLRRGLKPIKKTNQEVFMKEYLVKKENGEYFLTTSSNYADAIEVPDGANIYARCNIFGDYKWLPKIIDGGWDFLWQRHTQPEELPLTDDEPVFDSPMAQAEREFKVEQCLENAKRNGLLSDPRVGSINDQYAEIERVQQSAWDKQEGGSHYKKLAIQPMRYALANKLDYAQANVVKYVTRHADKNGKEDLLKAIHNIELMIEHYYG